MRSGISDRIGLVSKGQIGIVGSSGKSKLQNLHAGKSEFPSQRIDLRRYESEIFSHQRQRIVDLMQMFEKPIARRLHPTSIDGMFIGGWNLPICLKAAKMIDSDQVEQLQLGFHPVDPE